MWTHVCLVSRRLYPWLLRDTGLYSYAIGTDNVVRCRSSCTLAAEYRRKDCIEAIRKKWPPDTIRFPVVFLDWLAELPVVGPKEDLVSRELLTDVVPFLAREYETEAVWLPALEGLCPLLMEEGVAKKLREVELTTVVIIHDPLENLFFMATEYCDEHLSQIETKKRKATITREARGDLEALFPSYQKERFVCLQKEGGSKYGALKTKKWEP